MVLEKEGGALRPIVQFEIDAGYERMVVILVNVVTEIFE